MLSNDARLERVVALIQRDITTHRTRKEFARQAYLSESQLCRLFKQEFGVPLATFVRRERLHKAAELLGTTNCSVKEISLSVGFVSGSHFDRCFKACYGSTPARFRIRGVAPNG